MSTPTNAEQEMLELINRFRLDPLGEYARLILSTSPLVTANPAIANAITFFGVDLNLFQQQLQSLTAATPLAWNTNLENAAALHSQVMISADLQSHQVPGELSLGDRVTAAGYSFSAVGENIFAYGQSAIESHAAFVIDWGGPVGGMQSPPGHRINIMSGSFTEIGIDITPESNPSTDVGPLVVTQNFGNRFNYAPQVVGVVFADADGDNFYDAGEGRAGVTVTAVGIAGTFSTTTWSSGGYQFAAPAGNYTLTFSGGGMLSSTTASVSLGSANVKVDQNLSLPANLDDIFTSTSANQSFDGGPGRDTVIFQGPIDQYSVIRAGGTITVTDSVVGRDGTDTSINNEVLRFSDRSLDLTMAVKAASVSAAQLGKLIELYIAYFNRVPEAAGLAYWIDKLASGQTLPQISAQFYDAGVAFSDVSGYTATMPLADFVRIVYANVLIRETPGPFAPPPGDVQYWVNELSSGRVTKEGLIARMLSDARLFTGDPTWGFIIDILDNKIDLGLYHAITLGLDYASASAAIVTTVALSKAVTSTSIDPAIAMIGLSDNVSV